MLNNISKEIFSEISDSCLFLESFNSCHLETSSDLAIQLREKGVEVSFCYMSRKTPLPDNKISFYSRNYLSRRKQLNVLHKILIKYGIEVLKTPEISDSTNKSINELFTSLDINSLEELQSIEYKGMKIGISVISTMCSLKKSDSLDFRIYKNEVIKRLITAAIVYERTEKLIKSRNWKYYIYFNGRSVTTYPIKHILRSSFKNVISREVTYQGNKPFTLLSHYGIFDPLRLYKSVEKSCNNISSDELESNAFKLISGSYGIDPYVQLYRKRQKKIEEKIKLKKNKKIITYFSSCEDEQIVLSKLERKEKLWTQIEAVRNLCELISNSDKLDYYIYIRLHPNLITKNWNKLSEWKNLERFQNVKVFPPKNDINSQALIQESEIVFTWGSSLTEYACYLRKPTIMLNDYLYKQIPIASLALNKIDLEDYLNNKQKIYKEFFRENLLKILAYRQSDGIPLKYFQYKEQDVIPLESTKKLIDNIRINRDYFL